VATKPCALLQSATDAWHAAFNSIPLQDGDSVLCSESEYGSNYLGLLRRQKQINFKIEIIPSDQYGQLDIEALKNNLHERVKIIAITHIPTNGGLVNPAEEIGKIANENNIYFLLDACQSVGQLPIDVQQLGCDFLAATGRKFLRAPRGTGFLYVNSKILGKLDPEKIDNWSAVWTSLNDYKLVPGAKRFENFERNYGLIMGLGAAVRYHLATPEKERYTYIQKLANYARTEINALEPYEIMDLGIHQCGIVTFKSNNETADTLVKHLSKNGIAASVSTPETTFIDAQKRNLTELIRVSFHYYNTIEEIDQLIEVLKQR